jgi:hypothetical protein
MSRRSLALTGLTAGLIALSLVPVVVRRQTPAKGGTPQKGPWKTPRTPDGQPDLQSVWDYRTLTPFERPKELGNKVVLTDEEARKFEQELNRSQNRDLIDPKKGGAGYAPERAGGVVPYNEFWYDRGDKISPDRRTSLIVDPPDGRLPARTPQGQARAAAAAEENREVQMGRPHADSYLDRPLQERCIIWAGSTLPIRPSAYNNNIELIQGPGYVVIVNEMIHEHRMVPLDGRPHIDQNISQWLGDSRGHWDGDTLVVETTNLRLRGDSSETGSGRVHLTERFTRTGPSNLTYRATVDDPETWTRPWTEELLMTKSSELIYEYACHEGNSAIVGVLGGVRAGEKKSRTR